MSNPRPIRLILRDVDDLIKDLTDHDELLYVATEIAYQLKEEILISTDLDEDYDDDDD